MTEATSRRVRSRKLQDPLSQLLASGALRSVVLFFATHEEATQRLLARRTIDASVLLGREIAPLVLTPAAWRAECAAGRPFYADVKNGPKMWIVRGGH